MTPNERPLSLEDVAELHDELQRAQSRWSLTDQQGAEQIIAVLERSLEADGGLSQDDEVFAAGLLLGDALTRAVAYEWVWLVYPNGLEAIAVVEPERRFVCLPVQFLSGARRDATALRTLWQVAQGTAPLGVRPNAYLPLG